MTTSAHQSPGELRRRTITRADWVPCKAAFIDCRTPGSDLKDNYSFIGVGVSQSAEQFINLSEPHGFQTGAAGMPHGTTNSLHVHFTAEVFINFGGTYRVRWGAEGADGEYLSTDGDIISAPPWIFRGFTNEGSVQGVLLTVLGHDYTGGIIWGPSVLEQAADHGLYLTQDNMLVDTVAGQPAPPLEGRITPMDQREIDTLTRYSLEAGELVAVHRKVHLWGTESQVFDAGTLPVPVLETAAGRIAPLVCYDLEFPELVQAAALAGAQIVTALAGVPAAATGGAAAGCGAGPGDGRDVPAVRRRGRPVGCRTWSGLGRRLGDHRAGRLSAGRPGTRTAGAGAVRRARPGAGRRQAAGRTQPRLRRPPSGGIRLRLRSVRRRGSGASDLQSPESTMIKPSGTGFRTALREGTAGQTPRRPSRLSSGVELPRPIWQNRQVARR
ncbi:hypothetical protein CGZ93_00095 [Enemella dayhoffiae]|uniref:CN hydrolase domain-containing protein n=1 Tax=Enemella dayhoffiae TaxID=2016507 RepID=A0A255HBL0_9ACTN|nr:hypothetical protein CGZ93_00095 [Enemella dayhoffiae]